MEAVNEGSAYIQAHEPSSENSILDKYQSGQVTYDQAEAKLKQLYRNNPDELDVAMATLNTYYGDQEVEWDEESGGGIVKEGIVFADCSQMLQALLSNLVEIHLESEAFEPDGDITEMLHDLIIKYQNARVR